MAFVAAMGEQIVTGGGETLTIRWSPPADGDPCVVLEDGEQSLVVGLATPVESSTDHAAATDEERRLLVCPLRIEGRLEGVVAVWRPQSPPFDPVDEEGLSALASWSSELLSSRMRAIQNEWQQRGLTALKQVSSVICNTTDVAVLFDAIARTLRGAVDFLRASLVLVGENGQPVMRASNLRDRGTRIERGEIRVSANVRRVLGTGRRVINPRIPLEDASSRALLTLGIRSTVVVPLVARGRVIGTLNVGSSEPAAFDERHASLLEAIASQIAQAVDNARAYTLRREAAELEQRAFHADRLASLGRVAAGVAHEINNPASFTLTNLHTMQTRIESLRGSLPDADREDLIAMVLDGREGVERIRDTVRELRAFARIDASGLERVSINELAQAAARIVRNQARHRAGLVLDLGDVPEIVGDATKLTQLLTNLLVNAIQAVDEAETRGETASEHRITLRTDHVEGSVVIVVDDTGPGIPTSQLDRVFDSFHTARGKRGGMGLGLSLCRDVAKLHRGTIRASNVEGQGARFEVRLPVDSGLSIEPAEDPSPAHSAAPTSGPVPSASKRAVERILIVDDEPNILRSLTRALGPKYHVTTTDDVGGALELLEQGVHFDVVLCDLMMPGQDGVELFDRVGALAPALQKHILFCTGGALTERTRSFIERESPRMLYKPVDIPELCAAIEAIGPAPRTRDTQAPPEAGSAG